MKKLLVADLISPQGHYIYNENLLTTLSKLYEIDFIGDYNLINRLKPIIKSVNFNTFNFLKKKENNLSFKIEQLFRIREIIKLNKDKKYDVILISSYDLVTLSLFSEKHFKAKVILVNHNNLSRIDSLIKRFCFKKVYSNFSVHLLFENIFKINLEKELKSSLDKCYIIPHFLISNSPSENNKKSTSDITKILYLGNDRDNKGLEVLMKAVNRFDRKDWLNNLEINVAGKLSKTYSCDKINFYNYRTSDSEYKKFILETDFIVLPYRNTFMNRVSGIFFESLSYEKPIIASDIDLFKQYFKEYGQIGYLFTEGNQESLFNLLVKLQTQNRNEYKKFLKNIKQMKEDYSIEVIQDAYKKLIG
ncbi:glycosyltransferase involved in cell wall biosynthesis [Sinobaca qinghaiensis]|uniref:Glycosyltransferase involved in cell wall biosynthesis n=1 Tax=Sinobaca qinghaiensis TaxID=342944 RepID=A0A419V897_9BACL|nr:glycosyltransferase [Sinobaca qinghaiensis]RKD76311.1 glycosyltransferase involved in cell wall biosynthesis [Sinobaca qinghaiensis]